MKKRARVKTNFKNKSTSKIIFSIFALFAFFSAANLFAQTVIVNPKIVIAVPKPPPRIPHKRVRNESEIPSEKSIAADAKVNISLCVAEGNVKINGWQRDEIRAYASGGNEVGFSVRDKNKETGKPNLLTVLGYDPQKKTEAGFDECFSGERIELDVPRGASLNITGREGDVSISSVNKAAVKNNEGNVFLNDIAQGVEVRNYQGDITVEKSRGAMTITNTNGNIVVFDTAGSEVGDALRAKTSSGGIVLQNVAQKQIEANSNTGSIKFDGAFASGGQYSFGTTNGAINLLIPADSSFKIEAFYGGAFQSEFPLKIFTEDVNPQAKRLIAAYGAGDASLSLRNLGGSIKIRKK
ncbi:MAG: DUF4097 family beta strand repeat-containing protein [Pyrinomonadaceae bacterium]